jgi:probable FeS assembly SUF system protein SufT
MEDHTGTKILTRDCEAIRIPSGETFSIAKGTRVVVTQALGGSFTIATDLGLARITDANADAGPAKVDEQAVWEQLRTCYDPEIPVNIVDLGLVYDCVVEQQDTQPAKVNVKMTLTAPGCGMGPTIAAEAKAKIESVPGVAEAAVELVWEPAWNQAMISEAGKMKLGLI